MVVKQPDWSYWHAWLVGPKCTWCCWNTSANALKPNLLAMRPWSQEALLVHGCCSLSNCRWVDWTWGEEIGIELSQSLLPIKSHQDRWTNSVIWEQDETDVLCRIQERSKLSFNTAVEHGKWLNLLLSKVMSCIISMLDSWGAEPCGHAKHPGNFWELQWTSCLQKLDNSSPERCWTPANQLRKHSTCVRCMLLISLLRRTCSGWSQIVCQPVWFQQTQTYMKSIELMLKEPSDASLCRSY